MTRVIKQPSKRERSPETVLIYSAGLSLREVAARAGLSYGRVRNLLAGSDLSRAGRSKIEAATGLTLWPNPTNPTTP